MDDIVERLFSSLFGLSILGVLLTLSFVLHQLRKKGIIKRPKRRRRRRRYKFPDRF